MKRVVHVVTTVRHGGAERVVLELARAEQARGWSPRIVCLHDVGELAPEFAAAGIGVELVEGADRPGALRTAQSLSRWLSRTEPDTVHSHNAAAQVAVGLGARMGWWPRRDGTLVHTEHGRLSDARPLFLALRRWTLGAFDAVVAVSEDVRQQMAQHRLGRTSQLRVIENGIDTSQFAVRDNTGIHELEILHVGRLERIKGQDVLVEAMRDVVQACEGARLVVVGDGSTRGALEAQARALGLDAQVRFVGATMNVKPYLARAGMFVLPSRSEGLSVALLEAMAAGLPIVATQVGGTGDALDHGSCGMLVPPDDPRALARAMVTLCTDRAKAAELGRSARLRAAERYSLDATVERYLAAYEGGER